MKFVFFRFLNNCIVYKNSNVFYNILIFLIFVLLVEDVCLIFCEFGLFVYLYCLIVKKKLKCDIKKYWLMVVFKY